MNENFGRDGTELSTSSWGSTSPSVGAGIVDRARGDEKLGTLIAVSPGEPLSCVLYVFINGVRWLSCIYTGVPMYQRRKD